MPKRTEIFSTKSSKGDGEQDQKSCIIAMFVKIDTGDVNEHYRSGELREVSILTEVSLICRESFLI